MKLSFDYGWNRTFGKFLREGQNQESEGNHARKPRRHEPTEKGEKGAEAVTVADAEGVTVFEARDLDQVVTGYLGRKDQDRMLGPAACAGHGGAAIDPSRHHLTTTLHRDPRAMRKIRPMHGENPVVAGGCLVPHRIIRRLLHVQVILAGASEQNIRHPHK
jgi:hypothetical protein